MQKVHTPEEAIEVGFEEMEQKFGIRFRSASGGAAVTWMNLEEREINFYGIPYGGVLFHLADCTAGAAFLSAGGIGPTVSGTITFMRSREGLKTLECSANVVKNGKTLCFVETETTDPSDGTVLCKASFIFSRK